MAATEYERETSDEGGSVKIKAERLCGAYNEARRNILGNRLANEQSTPLTAAINIIGGRLFARAQSKG
jgi:hypothetical protein